MVHQLFRSCRGRSNVTATPPGESPEPRRRSRCSRARASRRPRANGCLIRRRSAHRRWGRHSSATFPWPCKDCIPWTGVSSPGLSLDRFRWRDTSVRFWSARLAAAAPRSSARDAVPPRSPVLQFAEPTEIRHLREFSNFNSAAWSSATTRARSSRPSAIVPSSSPRCPSSRRALVSLAIFAIFLPYPSTAPHGHHEGISLALVVIVTAAS